jgi:hypothetical protein
MIYAGTKAAGVRGVVIFSKVLDEVSCKKRALAFVKAPPIAGLAENAA